jgi:hypothetical protein
MLLILSLKIAMRCSPLRSPKLLAFSSNVAALVGLPTDVQTSMAFLRFFSGDLTHAIAPIHAQAWCTGYALSIYGSEMTDNCPFRTGNGYGDGRAVSIAEVHYCKAVL